MIIRLTVEESTEFVHALFETKQAMERLCEALEQDGIVKVHVDHSNYSPNSPIVDTAIDFLKTVNRVAEAFQSKL